MRNAQGNLESEQTKPDISVIISTRNRADSLAITLESLASANREGVRVEVIVADNASQDHTKRVAESFGDRIPVRYCYVPTVGVYGKSHALNHALDSGNIGELIAVLDDDVTVDPNWLQAVMAISRRWPDKDNFTGNTYTIWPDGEVPAWAKDPALSCWIFSSYRVTESDLPQPSGMWWSGNHWWFRSRVVANGRRFKDLWFTEPDFQLDLEELGLGGIASSEAVIGHRVQRALLQKDLVLKRAKNTGAGAAFVRLQPYRKTIKQARLLSTHPWLGRAYLLANYTRWRARYILSYCYPSDRGRFSRKVDATHHMTLYLEMFRMANRLDDYRLRKWARSHPTPEKAH